MTASSKTNGKTETETRKTPLFDLALASPDAATFESKAKEAGHTVASFSANGPWDWYYKAVQQYIDTHMGGEDDGSTYVVLAAIGQYTGMTQEEVDAFLTERRETMGAGAADRLAKAREKAQGESKRKDTIIQALMKQLNLTQEQVDALAAAEA